MPQLNVHYTSTSTSLLYTLPSLQSVSCLMCGQNLKDVWLKVLETRPDVTLALLGLSIGFASSSDSLYLKVCSQQYRASWTMFLDHLQQEYSEPYKSLKT
ncbi:hypothetical protein BgiBS90_024276 [Biomphalaria glabrata]|nr:hypothetical protein BgiBS90_024276 [Biomphalaria glabrata]